MLSVHVAFSRLGGDNVCLYLALCCYRGAPEAQLVGHTKGSPADHMETSLSKSQDDLQFYQMFCSLSSVVTQHLGSKSLGESR